VFETNVTIQGHERIDFDKKKIRKAMRLRGRDIQKEARRLIARRAISAPGEYPGRRKGRLWRSIKYKVSRSGFLVRVAPYMTAEMGEDFYPAFLYYGSSRGLKKRDNYMEKAHENRREASRAALTAALQDSLIPRK